MKPPSGNSSSRARVNGAVEADVLAEVARQLLGFHVLCPHLHRVKRIHADVNQVGQEARLRVS